MNEAMFAVMWLIYAFWMGHEVGLRRERKRGAAGMDLALCVVRQAMNIKTSRRFTGDGPAIRNETVWTIGDLGKFKITLEEQSA